MAWSAHKAEPLLISLSPSRGPAHAAWPKAPTINLVVSVNDLSWPKALGVYRQFSRQDVPKV